MSIQQLLAVFEEENKQGEYFGTADHGEMLPPTAQNTPASRQDALLTLVGTILLTIAIICLLFF